MGVLRRSSPILTILRALRHLALAGAVVALAACNAMKLGYQQGDRLAFWWIDNYVDVSASQEPLTRDAIARFFAWHRREQLPEIAGLLRQAKSEVQRPVTPAEVARIQEGAQRLARVAFDRSTPDVADLLLTLTPEQIARMEKKFGDANAKYRKEYLRPDPAAREEARYDKVMDYARLIYGRFSDEQENTIRRALGPVVQGAEARYDERVKRQQEWLALARQVQATHPPRAQVVEMLKRYGDHWQNPPTRERDARYDANNEAGLVLTATIANLTTPEQKNHAAERFQKWIDDASALMRESPPGTANAAGAQPARADN
ncbi:DUF6279 family lipoprotein [Cupriavidus sp. 30B13]|uniref:DUF6279 family lipoprotein n=1 Tax=Cupriavidus sp. 30B13 TaxID=3384241 RepID=UPI003B911246